MKWKAFLLFIVLGFTTYGLSLQNEFVFDDEEQVVNNVAIHDISNIPSFFFSSTMNQGGSAKMGGIYYKPLMTTAYALIWSLSGNDPMLFHIFQVAVHSTNAFLIFLLFINFAPFWPSLLLALLFLLHPQNTENAVYIANYQDVLFMFFGLLALNVLVKKSGSWVHAFSISALLLCSLLSKESGVLFVAASAIFIFIFRFRNQVRAMAAVALTVGTYAFMRFGLAELYNVKHGVAPISHATPLERFLTMPSALTHYFMQFLAPLHLTTTRNWVVTEANLEFWPSFFFMIAITSLVCWWCMKTKSKLAAFFALSLGAGLFLHSQLLAPLDGTVADRWFYFPMFALLGLIIVSVPWDRISIRTTIAVAVPILLLMGGRSMARSLDWKNGYTLYGHDVAIAPDSYDMQNNYGVELFRHGKVDEALPRFKRSTELAPHWTINWNNLGAAYDHLKRLTEAEYAYCRSINNGVYYLAFENYAGILIRTGRLERAMSFIEKLGLVGLPHNAKLLEMREFLNSRQVRAGEIEFPLNCELKI